MKKLRQPDLNFLIDKLTNSIENVQTSDTFATDITLLSATDFKLVTKKTVGNLIGSMN